MSYQHLNEQPNFKPVQLLFENRLRQFTNTGGQYHSLNLPQLYDKERHEIGDLKAWRVPDKDGKTQRPLFKDINWDNVEWNNIGLGYNFGPSWKTWWVEFHIDIPESWLKEEVIEIEWDSSSEAFIYDSKGFPLQAFTGGGERNLFTIPKEYRKTGSQRFYIEVACNGMFGNGADGHPDPNRYFRLNKAHLVVPNMDARRLFWDFWILGDAARELPGNSWQKHQARAVANKIMDVFDPDDPLTVLKGRKLAQELLGKDIDSDDVFDEYSNDKTKRVDVFSVGNCHIDTAWEWPFAETKRKIVRSWTTQIKIADEYPEYVFVALQMQQFKWLKLYHPEIYKKVHEKFTTNQFIPVGGSWVENDTNLPNGESLIRQFLLGQRFQFNEFGFYSNIFWLPDTFGYSSQVPQICRLVGISRFLTQKLSWNNINNFPLSTFNWRSLDGSQVLVHMPPANTYTAAAHFGDVVRSLNQHKNHDNVPAGLLLYGHGDGGGGPTGEMIEKLRRCRGLANTTGAIPTVHVGNTVDDFYEHILDNSNQGEDLPTWAGEIYLEFHRGTYTTQALTKKLVRFGEVKLHDLELIAGLVSIVKPDYKYPAEEIQNLWEDLALSQFHDVIPGSCIGMVYYEEVIPMLTKNLENTKKLIKEATNACVESEKGGKKLLQSALSVANTLPWARHEIIEVRPDQNELFLLLRNTSKSSEKNTQEAFKVSVITDSKELKINDSNKLDYPASVKELDDGSFILSNDLIIAKISKTGIITSLYDTVNKREVISTLATKQTRSEEGQIVGGNQYVLFDDEPLNFPNWDTELYSLNKFKFLKNGKTTVKSNGPLEASVVVTHEISEKSLIETQISIQGLVKANNLVQNNYIKFKSHVKWHETYKFLKVQFPTTIYTAPNASYETQFGVTERPTHFNTSWDVAKFEVAHHKFMDLSERNYGVSVLNNSKYGGAIHGNLIRLSLLRSAKAPDDLADMGEHDFEYALYPHAGPLGMSTVQLGYNLNYPVDEFIVDKSRKLPKLLNAILFKDIPESLVLSHVKRGENDYDVNQLEAYKTDSKEKSIVLRVYESLGGKASGTLTFDEEIINVAKVFRTNSLEDEKDPTFGKELKIKDNELEILLNAFEIATYKLILD